MPPIDTFKPYSQGLESPASNFVAVTPSDSAELAVLPRFLIIGTAGNVSLVNADGQSVTIPVQAGQVLPLRPSKVNATGTTATGIVAAW